MCRIFGYFEADIDPRTLPELATALRHGGPDGAGWRRGAAWGLGATRLAVMDPAGGDQPYELGGITAVFNGEIYNHASLREELTGYGYRFSDRCDGSIIPALYHRFGPGFADRIDGMFAIAVVDRRERPQLVLACDDAGMKPIYTWRPASGGVCFASEIGALAAFPGFAPVAAPGGLDAYLTTKAPFGNDTMLEGVRVLGPGATVVHPLGAPPRRLDREPLVPGIAADDPREYAAALRSALDHEVRALARADVPVSVICSGGLDSSLVTSLIAAGRDDVEAFHIRYDGDWPHDERRWAAEVADRSGARLREVVLDPVDIGARLPQVVAHLGQPNADPITVSSLVLFEAIRDAGYKVTLSGDGADELFGGYDRVRAAVAADAWIPDYVDALAAAPPALREDLYSDDYRAHLRERGTERDRLVQRLGGAESRWDDLWRLEVGTRLPAYHLRRVDHLSMAAAVEVRVPFCQRSIRSIAANLPDGLRPRGDAAKPALYAAAGSLVPPGVLHRPKQPFTLPIAAMMGHGSPLWKYLREVLLSGDVTAGGQLDERSVRALADSVAGRAESRTALALWALAVYRLWYDALPAVGRSRGGE